MSQQGPTNPLVSLDRVSFTYEGGGSPAVDDLCLDIAPGDFLGVIGPSGAGKTTLCSVLSGAVPHHFAGEFRGVATVCGMDSCEVGLTDVSRKVGSVLQDIDAQMVASSVEDEMLYGLENFGVPHDQIPGRIGEALATCGISGLLHREVATLSGGQKQKLAIAAILAIRPSVMVLDEPTAALDPASSLMVFQTLRELNRREGITVVVVEQKVALLCEFCRHVAVLREGRLALLGTPREVFSHSEELRSMGVDSPRVTRVSNLLRSRGLAREGDVSLTVGEAAALVSRVVGERGSLAWAATRPPLRLEGGRRHGEPTALELASDPMLTFDHVGFSYPGGTASVEDVSLELRPGELVAVVGQNGAGKTTVTKLMNGLLKPSSGRVTIAGLDTSRARTSQIAQHVSTLFQDPDRQICKETVVEEVAFSLQLLGTPDAEALSRARDCVEHFGLPAEAAPFSLGRGQRQIVALASVVVTNPEVLILDEPTSGLDYRECMTVMEAVEVARSRGCAVAMVCHDMEVVSDFATRVVVMADGRVLADGLPGEVFADEGLLARACVAAPQVTQLARRLSADVSRGYEGVTEVHDIVAVTEGLVG
ncbi:ABC transporter ATP-binding protein [Olsenella sp. DNF00959]|uniref:ABC transporter ATP-binding protein n=1 Tax=Olsenella sp. DNF00959 TaxID=1476999 RepID=UPI0007801D11|nr:energy-coupling factor transporter ATPase [Olsenella sp. DNF00959]KXB62644.1 cobalt ABC transporter, ATP-binding protein [Olsenella sp. DNF00959]